MNKRILGVTLSLMLLGGIFTGCKKDTTTTETSYDPHAVQYLTLSYSGSTLFEEKQYDIYSVQAPEGMTVSVIYEGDEQRATEYYTKGATFDGVTYVVINDKTIKLNVDGVEQTFDVTQYKNDGIMESEFSS